MKIEPVPTEGRMPKYVLRPTTSEEVRFFTILRDYLSKSGAVLRYIGSEDQKMDLVGMPHNASIGVSFAIEHPQGHPLPPPPAITDPNKLWPSVPDPKPARPKKDEWFQVG